MIDIALIDTSTWGRLIEEVRPTGGLVALDDVREPLAEPVIAYGRDASAFARVAPLLPYGSNVVLFSSEDIEPAHDFLPWAPPGTPPGSRVWVRQAEQGEGYLAILLEALQRTDGPVLELGSGGGSTPVLHDACAEQGRLLVTVDDREEWLSEVHHLASDTHIMEVCALPASSPRLSEDWAIVFVDHSPGHTRVDSIEHAREHAEYVVIHDTEQLSYGYEPVLATFKYRRDFRKRRPWTTVVSNTHEVWSSK